jgi:MarR family transcriptional regulator, multiple gene regulator MgrA
MGTIEDIIQQKKFTDDYHKAYVGVAYLYNVLDYIHQQLFKEHDITSQQYNALRILRGQHPKPATIGLIKERMIDRNSDASRIVERLRKAGYVERVTCENDRRAVDVIITEKGLTLLKKLDPVITTINTPLRMLDAKEAAELNQLLDTMLSRWIEREK